MDEQIASEYVHTPQTVKGVCKHCGKQMVEHIVKDGARYHVLSWGSIRTPINGQDISTVKCSEPDCVINHGPGYCVPFEHREDNE